MPFKIVPSGPTSHRQSVRLTRELAGLAVWCESSFTGCLADPVSSSTGRSRDERLFQTSYFVGDSARRFLSYSRVICGEIRSSFFHQWSAGAGSLPVGDNCTFWFLKSGNSKISICPTLRWAEEGYKREKCPARALELLGMRVNAILRKINFCFSIVPFYYPITLILYFFSLLRNNIM